MQRGARSGADSLQGCSFLSPRRLIGPLATTGLTLLGLALAAVLALAQASLNPPTAYRAGQAQDSGTAFDSHAVPLIGSPNSPYVVTMFFDYKCPHCQRLHSMLAEAIRRYDGKLAFALFPAPLNTQCNPYVSRNLEQFKDSCELAKIGLAVWLADHDAFAAFDNWVYSPPEPGALWRPRSLAEAQAKAFDLVGQSNFDAAQADPWIDAHMQTSIQMYGETALSGNAVPKLVFGARWVTPEPRDTDDLVSVLHDGLGIPAP